MDAPASPSRSTPQGFSLIELIVIIVAMAIAATGVISLNQGIMSGQTENTQIQVSSALMQECAEIMLATPYDSVTNTLCTGVTLVVPGSPTNTTYGPPSVTVAPSNTAPCPYTSGDKCKLVTINLITPPVVLMLVKP